MIENLAICCFYITMCVLFFGSLYVLTDWLIGMDRIANWFEELMEWLGID